MEESIVINKTQELCKTLLEAPDFVTVRQQIDSFMTDESAKEQYQRVSEKMDELNQKKNMGEELTDAEIDAFNTEREGLMNNSVAKGFIEAQREVQKMQDLLGQYVAKTFELGRVPNPDDFRSGSCGTGCGCH